MVYDLSARYDTEHDAFLGESRKTLASSMSRFEHAMSQLTDDELWWRPHPGMNALGNLVLHLCGNLQQWLIAGVGGAPLHRDRPAEFSTRGGIGRQELQRRLRETLAASDGAIAAIRPGQLLDRRQIQGYDTTVLAAVYHAVEHFEGHAQEAIYIARLRRGEDYRFLWEPSANQQGGAGATVKK